MKQRKGALNMILVLALVAVGAFLLLGDGVKLPSLAAADTPSPGEGLSECQVEDTTLTLRAYDLENKGTAAGGAHRVYVNGDFTGTVADGGTTTVSPGDEVTVLFGDDSNATQSYYGASSTETIGCVGTKTMSGFQKNYNSSAVSISFFNSDDGLINTVWGAGADTQALGADGEETLEMTLQATSEDYFGDDTIIIVFDANQNAFDEIKVEGGKKVSTPGQHTAVASSKAYAWEVSGLKGSKRARYDIVLDAGSTEPSGSNGNVTVTVYDKGSYVNAESNAIESGVEDEDDNDVGMNNANGNIYVS